MLAVGSNYDNRHVSMRSLDSSEDQLGYNIYRVGRLVVSAMVRSDIHCRVSLHILVFATVSIFCFVFYLSATLQRAYYNVSLAGVELVFVFCILCY